MTRRLFIALPIPAAITKPLEHYRDHVGRLTPYLRWHQPAHWHLTLVFLGDVDQAALAAIIECLERCCRNQPPITLQAGQPIYAPPHQPSSMVWIPWHDTGRFSQFTNGLYQAFLALALTRPDSFGNFLQASALPFRAHITLAYFRPGQPPANLLPLPASGIEDQPIAFDSVVLYESHPQPNGSRYQPLHTIPLVGSDTDEPLPTVSASLSIG